MFKLLFFTFFFLFFSKINAHQYFFAFAEVEYNQMQEQLEGTLIISAHDMEDVLNEKGIFISKLDKILHDSASISKLAEFVFSEFKFFNQEKEIKLNGIDFFITRNGMIEFYFKSEKVKPADFIEVEFTTLMEKFPQQQNKITFIQKTDKQTAVFILQNKRNKLYIIT